MFLVMGPRLDMWEIPGRVGVFAVIGPTLDTQEAYVFSPRHSLL